MTHPCSAIAGGGRSGVGPPSGPLRSGRKAALWLRPAPVRIPEAASAGPELRPDGADDARRQEKMGGDLISPKKGSRMGGWFVRRGVGGTMPRLGRVVPPNFPHHVL